jgi:TAT (twin-arginine translocation) pathway signal sequence
MKTMHRRDFLKMAGAGTAVVVAGVAMPAAGFFGWNGKNILRFRAVSGLPNRPLPAYASYVIEGQVNIRERTGTLAKSLYAGAPDAMSGVVFPGTTRTVKVTNVKKTIDGLMISGRVNEMPLLRGESPEFSIMVDQANGMAQGNFLGSKVVMKLDV